jgi:hypothetical protein
MLSLVLAAQAGDPAAIQQKLNAQFKLTRITADRSDIVTAGDVVAIHKAGLMMYAVASPLPPSNSYKNGKIGQGWGGFGSDLLIGMATPGGGTAANYPHRPFVAEEKCWVTGVQAQKDGVLFQLYSDPYDGIRYYANLKIPFPNKKEVPSVDAALQTVAEVLTVVPQQDQSAQPAPEAEAAPGTNPSAGGQPVELARRYDLQGGEGHITFASDSSMFIMRAPSGPASGMYQVNGDTLTLTFTSTRARKPVNFKIQPDRLVADDGVVWLREGGAPAPAPETASPAPIASPAPVPMPVIAPPPPPADAPPPTIAVGQTKDQVTAAFGQPARIAKLGVKEIFYYKDMKVTFTNGKVSNVE